MRGQRFDINLSSDDETDTSKPKKPFGAVSLALVRDIKERPSPSSVPSAPRTKYSETGFPAHNKRRTKPSTFKQARANPRPKTAEEQTLTPTTSHPQSSHENNESKVDAAREIDEENKLRMAQMSPEEIEEARQELLSTLSPSLIERLLKRANIDEDKGAEKQEIKPRPPNPQRKSLDEEDEKLEGLLNRANIGKGEEAQTETAHHAEPKQLPQIQHSFIKKVSFGAAPRTSDPDAPPLNSPPDLLPASSTPTRDLSHYPQTSLSSPPPLDPDSPNFLSLLRETYFPSLPATPQALSWLAPTPNTDTSSYSPNLDSLPASSLRFDFQGRLLPPKLAAQIPTTKGLHHHGDAPDAAGYTIPELARLARSAFPAQRCIAFQTLGRVLYRLGRGDFGHVGGEDEDKEKGGGDLVEGLWELMEQGKVVNVLCEVAGREGESAGNRSCWVFATEAVWLWRKGGGRRWEGR